MKTLRVINFNIQGAKSPGRKNHLTQERAWHLLASFNADLALVQEVEHKAIPGWASDSWSLVQCDKSDAGPSVADWGSVIAARPELGIIPRDDLLEKSLVDLIYDYAVFAEIKLPDGASAIVSSIHAPANKLPRHLKIMGKKGALTTQEMQDMAQSGDDAWALDLFFRAIAPMVKGKRFILGGDLNTSRLFDLNSRARQKGQLPVSTMFFTRARDAGWYDCHGRKNEERSFLRPNSLPHQLDHLFCDKKTYGQLVDSNVHLDWVIYELSDHAPGQVLDLL